MKHTLESIAKLAGVSRGTVSRVINNQLGVKPQVRARVQEIIRQTGYHPNAQARSLAGGRTENIGVVVFGDDAQFLTHHIFYEVLQGIQSGVTANDYDLLLFANRSERDRDYWRRIGDKRKMDGLIVMGEHIREEYLAYYHERGIPFVLVGKRHFDRIPLVCVTSDYRQGAYDATKHLIERGCRRILFMRGFPNTYHESEKQAGYEEALREAGLAPGPSLMADGMARQDTARSRMEELLADGQRFDGVLAGNDLMAFGVIEALERHGFRVPEDVSVTGYDDIQAAAYFHPSLTTVRQDKMGLGRKATELLLQRLQHPAEFADGKGQDVFLASELIVREST